MTQVIVIGTLIKELAKMSREPLYIYRVRLQDGEKVSDFLSNELPPNIGGVLEIMVLNKPERFEVIHCRAKTFGINEVYILKVRRRIS